MDDLKKEVPIVSRSIFIIIIIVECFWMLVLHLYATSPIHIMFINTDLYDNLSILECSKIIYTLKKINLHLSI